LKPDFSRKEKRRERKEEKRREEKRREGSLIPEGNRNPISREKRREEREVKDHLLLTGFEAQFLGYRTSNP
jgi:hypothetical protein